MKEEVPILQGAVTKAETDISTIINTTIPLVDGTAKAAKSGVDNIINDTLPIIQKSVKDLTIGASGLKTSVDNVIEKLIPDMDTLIRDVSYNLGIIEGKVTEITDTIIPGINTTIGTIKNDMETSEGIITGIQSDILSNAAAVAGIVDTSIPRVQGAVTTLTNEMNSKIAGVSGDVLDNAGDITNVFSAIGLDKDNFVKPAENLLKQINENAVNIDILLPLQASITELERIYSPLSSSITAFNTTLGQNTTKIGEAVSDITKAKELTEGVEGIMNSIESDLSKLMGLTGTLQGDATELVTAFNTAIDSIKGHFTTAKGKLDSISRISFTAPSFAGGNSMTLTVPGVDTQFIDTINSQLNSLKIL
jgi:phage-related protein